MALPADSAIPFVPLVQEQVTQLALLVPPISILLKESLGSVSLLVPIMLLISTWMALSASSATLSVRPAVIPRLTIVSHALIRRF